MPESQHVVKSSLSFAKLVATPTETAWSQAYNAGNLFACLSLSLLEKDETIFLHALGKDTFNLLQSEFFSLEDKSTDAIKQAITKSLENIPATVMVSLTLANFKDNLLTVFIVGNGKAVMKRDTQIGTLLEKKTEDDAITYAAGYLKNSDTIILQTGAFAKGTSQETVAAALELALPNDIVESLSPQMHEKDNGAQAAIVVMYHAGTPHTHEEDAEEQKEPTLASVYEQEQEQQHQPLIINDEREKEDDNDEDEEETKEKRSFKLPFPKFHFPKLFPTNAHLTHKRKLFLSIAVILFILLGASIFLTVKKKHDAQQLAVFQSIYNPAKQDYEEGQALESFGTSHDSYVKAESKLKEADGKLSKGSTYDKQIQDLSAKVESALQGGTSANATPVKEASAPTNSLLDVAKKATDGKAFGQDTNNVYFVNDSVVSEVNKSSGTKKDIIKNDNAWTNEQAVVPYQGNIFVLDQKNVLKYVAGGSGFAKTSYFTGGTPDLSQATSMAIDGSVWILTKDGKILKFTKGKQDSYPLSGLDKPLQGPTRIATDITMSKVYVMDNGGSRIVVFDKNGAFQKTYNAPIIAKATEFDVDEAGKKILILSSGKVWELDL